MCSTCGCTGPAENRLIRLQRDILASNDAQAQNNRRWFSRQDILALNLLSSPGSGKTSLLTRTVEDLKNVLHISVIEGDQATARDAQRIRATGANAVQVNTGTGCHLDARQIRQALDQLRPPPASIVFIENVGNLVCPAAFDLGERFKVALLSVTEGEDKPLKYPALFQAADVLLINKIDLLPHVTFSPARCIDYALRVNPRITVLQLSAHSGEGMAAWYRWLRKNLPLAAP